MIDIWSYPLLTLLAVFTAFIDAIAGGGGLIFLPALLLAGVPPVNALATLKMPTLAGSAMALREFRAKGLIDPARHRMTFIAVAIGCVAGVLLVKSMPLRWLEVAIPVLLAIVALYLAIGTRRGDAVGRDRTGPRGYAPIGGLVGLYSGAFGPGAGSFFIATLSAARGMGLTRATALTKLFNIACTATALIVWAILGDVWWGLGLAVALGGAIGGYLGSRTAIRYGARLIRPLIVATSLALAAKLGFDYLAG